MIARWKLTLHLRGPVLTKSTAPGAYGVDAMMARDAMDRPCLPGSLIKGRLRQAWEELAIATADRLGPDPRKAETVDDRNVPDRATVRFSDLTGPATDVAYRYRVQIEPMTGAASEHSLLVAESAFASGEEAVFEGNVEALVAGEEAMAVLERDLLFGLRFISHVGAQRGCGFGKVLRADLEPLPDSDAGTPVQIPSAATSFALCIRPHSPLCFAQPRRRGNVFESTEIIPGAAIKGCLAEMWSRDGTGIPLWFDLLRITHAFPAKDSSTQRPVIPPMSIVMDGKEAWHDSALIGKPFLFRHDDLSPEDRWLAPKGWGSWKPCAAQINVRSTFGLHTPSRDLRVRTAINRQTQRADDNRLFAQELIRPDGTAWFARVELAGIKDPTMRADAIALLTAAFANGLRGLGKTKATADADVLTDAPSAMLPEAPKDVIVITLQTPTLLLSQNRTPLRTRDDLHQAYAAAFTSLCPDLQLLHFQAHQSLAGGGYLWRRFQKANPYNPWLLTDPGSVFVFRRNEKAAAFADNCHATGLPIPDDVRSAWHLTGDPAEDWKRCPFLPENGYGEIAVDLACHTERDVRDEKRCTIETLIAN